MCIILLGCIQIWHFYRTLFRGLLFSRTQCRSVLTGSLTVSHTKSCISWAFRTLLVAQLLFIVKWMQERNKTIQLIRTRQCCWQYAGLSDVWEHKWDLAQTHSTCELSEKPRTGRKSDNFFAQRSYWPTDSGDQMSTINTLLPIIHEQQSIHKHFVTNELNS